MKSAEPAAFVADASVAIAWVIPSQASAASRRLLDEVSAGAIFAVPTLWAFEVAYMHLSNQQAAIGCDVLQHQLGGTAKNLPHPAVESDRA